MVPHTSLSFCALLRFFLECLAFVRIALTVLSGFRARHGRGRRLRDAYIVARQGPMKGCALQGYACETIDVSSGTIRRAHARLRRGLGSEQTVCGVPTPK
jgi:hypothetical protein